jgi:hypothetical protein
VSFGDAVGGKSKPRATRRGGGRQGEDESIGAMSPTWDSRIERITAHAALDDADEQLGKAEAAAEHGDPDWAHWVDQYRAGHALIVALDVTVEYFTDTGERNYVHAHNDSVWVERHVDPPMVQEQIRQVASKDFSVLASALRERGLSIEETDLDEMYVEVCLDRSVRDDLAAPGALERGERPDIEPWEYPG